MIITQQQMSQSTKQMRGGDGVCHMLEFLSKEEMNHARLFGTITIPPNASIGEHPHIDETEYYWIIEGEGVLTESSGVHVVKKGDLVVTSSGESHAIRNEKNTPLVLLALIILD
ncbi:MAG: cupin domain-containing protein [Sphaerochaetaceae bacterium]|jgi:mannose-6-phosphate isomerase-like protein (cupin superfamily)